MAKWDSGNVAVTFWQRQQHNERLCECLDLDEMHVFRFAFYLFFFPARVSALGEKSTVHTRFSIVHRLKNIENGTHSIIHTFKNYFRSEERRVGKECVP